jgi:hypothetical protein
MAVTSAYLFRGTTTSRAFTSDVGRDFIKMARDNLGIGSSVRFTLVRVRST